MDIKDKKINFNELLQEYEDTVKKVNVEDHKKRIETLNADIKYAERDIKDLEKRSNQVENEMKEFDEEKYTNPENIAFMAEELKPIIEKAKKQKEQQIKEISDLKDKKEAAVKKMKEEKDNKQEEINKVENAGKDIISKAERKVAGRNDEVNKQIEAEKEKARKEIEKLKARKEKYGIDIKNKDGNITKQLTSEEKTIIEKIDTEINSIEESMNGKVGKLEKEIDKNERGLKKLKLIIKNKEKERLPEERLNLENEMPEFPTPPWEINKTKEDKSEKEEEGKEETKIETSEPEIDDDLGVLELPDFLKKEEIEEKREEKTEEIEEKTEEAGEKFIPKLFKEDKDVVIVESETKSELEREEDNKKDDVLLREEEKLEIISKMAQKRNTGMREIAEEIKKLSKENKKSYDEVLDNLAQLHGVKPLEIKDVKIDEFKYVVKFGTMGLEKSYEIGKENEYDNIKINIDRKSEAQYREVIANEFPESEKCIKKLDMGLIKIYLEGNRKDLCQKYIDSINNGKADKDLPNMEYNLLGSNGLSRNETVLRRNARNAKKIEGMAAIAHDKNNVFTRAYDFVRETGADIAVKISKSFGKGKERWQKEVKQLQDGMKLMLNSGEKEETFRETIKDEKAAAAVVKIAEERNSEETVKSTEKSTEKSDDGVMTL